MDYKNADNRVLPTFKTVKPLFKWNLKQKYNGQHEHGRAAVFEMGQNTTVRATKSPDLIPFPPSSAAPQWPHENLPTTLRRDNLTVRNLTGISHWQRAERCIAHPYFPLLRLRNKGFRRFCMRAGEAAWAALSGGDCTSHLKWFRTTATRGEGNEAEQRLCFRTCGWQAVMPTEWVKWSLVSHPGPRGGSAPPRVCRAALGMSRRPRTKCGVLRGEGQGQWRVSQSNLIVLGSAKETRTVGVKGI